MPRNRKPQTAAAAKNAAAQPPRAPTGMPQGAHQALIQSQQAAPVANESGRMDAAIAAAMQGGAAGMGGMDAGLLGLPTARPNEAPQAGLPMGPGAGPEAVQAPMVPNQPEDFEMAKYLPMLEALADQPNVSSQTRNYVRRLRGSVPSDITMQSLVQPHELPQ